MKTQLIYILMAACLLSCSQNNTGAQSYTNEFTSTFITEKNSFLSQLQILTTQSERLDLMSLEVLQSGPAFLPFTTELIGMKRLKEAVKADLNRNVEKMQKLSDELIERKKDQPTLEKDWRETKTSIKNAIDALQNMNAENEAKFRQFTTHATGHPIPSGPRMEQPVERPALK